VDEHRRGLIAEALERAGGNRSRAARDLGLSRQALLYLIKQLGVSSRRSGARSMAAPIAASRT
jgi:DNA-binding NtrC family response regulator